MRAPGSLGAFDVLDIHEGVVRFIECKATAAGPYAGFLPADRKRLIEVAQKAGAIPLLCWWPKRAKPKFIERKDWPGA